MKTKSVPVTTSASYNFSIIQVAILIVMVALVVIPLFSSSSASSLKIGSRASQLPQIAGADLVAPSKGLALAVASNPAIGALLQPFPQTPGETVEIFAADCTTSKTEFALGEVICAKTDGVDLTVPGNYYMNWHHPDGSTTNGGTITQNPQYFLFDLPTSGANNIGTWKANIGRVTPAEPSIIGNPPTFTVDASGAMATFAPDCVTPKTDFVLGDIVCARATNLVGFRFAWVDAAGYVEQKTDITTDPQTDTFQLPLTQTSVIDGVTVDNRGQWRVNAITSRSSVKRGTFFDVRDPLNPVVDLSITKSQLGDNVQQGGQVQYEVVITNRGPDAAANVHFVDDTFTGATFDSVTETSELGFNCTGTESADCTLASLPAGTRATFLLNFTAGSAGETLQNTAEVSSDTTEQNELDNSFTTAAATVGSGTPPPACTLNCPNNINAVANTEENGQRGAHVTYDPPRESGTCGTVTSTPASGSFFPVGTTTVTATSTEGNGSCSFTITVEDTGSDPPTISCPANQTGTADSNCAANISVGTATATGNNVTVIGFRSDGQPLYTCDEFGNCTRNSSDQPFATGTTTITWIAYTHDTPGPYNAQTGHEETHRTGSASCSQTIMVDDITPPTINAPPQTVSADENCQAPVPDYSNTATDNCACASSDESEACEGRQDIVVTQSIAAGTLVGQGTHTITLTANDGSSNNNGAGNTTTTTTTFTVNDTTAPTVTAPADSSASADANCQAPVPDYTANSTASDNCDSSLTITPDPAPGTMVSGSGPHIVTVSSTDDANNTGSDTVIFTVNDVTAPTITAPPDSSASADDDCLAPVPDYTATSTTSDNCDSNLTVTQSPEAGTMVGKGSHTVTVTATDDAGLSSSDTVVFTVNDTTAPVISCPANITTNTAPGTCSATVVTPPATATDNCDSTPTITGTRSDGQPLIALYPKGTTTITWRATDDDGNYSECNQTVTVVDNEAPVITFNGQTPSMWPPNHNYRTFTTADFISSVSDNCDSLSVNDVYITHATSDEAEESLLLGDGATFNDIVIDANCKSVQLRAERVNSGNGRVYTIYFKLVDSSGNITTGSAKVYSPKNQGETPGDDAVQYTVTSSCP